MIPFPNYLPTTHSNSAGNYPGHLPLGEHTLIEPYTAEWNSVVYRLDVSCYSSCLKVTGVYRVQNYSTLRKQFRAHVKDSICVDSWLNTQSLPGIRSEREILTSGFPARIPGGMVVPAGSIDIEHEKEITTTPVRTYEFLLCSLGIGRPLCVDSVPPTCYNPTGVYSYDDATAGENGRISSALMQAQQAGNDGNIDPSAVATSTVLAIPEGYDTLYVQPPNGSNGLPPLAMRARDLADNAELSQTTHILPETTLSGPNHKTRYVVNDGRRILPMYIVIFELGPTDSYVIDGSLESKRIFQRKPLCSSCGKREATVFCVNDDAVFCEECDLQEHQHGTKFARNHKRISLAEKPILGKCPLHPNNNAEYYDLKRKLPACDECRRENPDLTTYSRGVQGRLRSLAETYDYLRELSKKSDPATLQRMSALGKQIRAVDSRLRAVYRNSASVESDLFKKFRAALQQLQNETQRKVTALLAEEYELRRQAADIEYIMAFFNKQRDLLPPSDFVIAYERHRALKQAILDSGRIPRIVDMPVEADIYINGDLSVASSSGIRSRLFLGHQADEQNISNEEMANDYNSGNGMDWASLTGAVDSAPAGFRGGLFSAVNDDNSGNLNSEVNNVMLSGAPDLLNKFNNNLNANDNPNAEYMGEVFGEDEDLLEQVQKEDKTKRLRDLPFSLDHSRVADTNALVNATKNAKMTLDEDAYETAPINRTAQNLNTFSAPLGKQELVDTEDIWSQGIANSRSQIAQNKSRAKIGKDARTPSTNNLYESKQINQTDNEIDVDVDIDNMFADDDNENNKQKTSNNNIIINNNNNNNNNFKNLGSEPDLEPPSLNANESNLSMRSPSAPQDTYVPNNDEYALSNNQQNNENTDNVITLSMFSSKFIASLKTISKDVTLPPTYNPFSTTYGASPDTSILASLEAKKFPQELLITTAAMYARSNVNPTFVKALKTSGVEALMLGKVNMVKYYDSITLGLDLLKFGQMISKNGSTIIIMHGSHSNGKQMIVGGFVPTDITFGPAGGMGTFIFSYDLQTGREMMVPYTGTQNNAFMMSQQMLAFGLDIVTKSAALVVVNNFTDIQSVLGKDFPNDTTDGLFNIPGNHGEEFKIDRVEAWRFTFNN